MPQTCPVCGGPVESGQACPRCLLKVAMGDPAATPLPVAGQPSPTAETWRLSSPGTPAPAARPGTDPLQMSPVRGPASADATPANRIAVDTEPPPSKIRGLEILNFVGRGGMGRVYRARQVGLDRIVAVKVLPRELAQDPEFVERFKREAKALASLSHPNIVGVYDCGIDAGQAYLVMEYVDGMNLRDLMRTRLKPAEALALVPQICDALEYAHSEGVIHRDIKPENILVDRKGRLRIADFGLAKLLRRDGGNITHTREVMGTPHYMAPEQIERPKDVDHRADIYALGVVFYEMLTGELPMGRFDPPSRRVQIDVRLDEVVLKALEKEPDRRYQRASHVKEGVSRLSADHDAPWAPSVPFAHLAGGPGSAPIPPPASRTPHAEEAGVPRAGPASAPGAPRPRSVDRREVQFAMYALIFVGATLVAIALGTRLNEIAVIALPVMVLPLVPLMVGAIRHRPAAPAPAPASEPSPWLIPAIAVGAVGALVTLGWGFAARDHQSTPPAIAAMAVLADGLAIVFALLHPPVRQFAARVGPGLALLPGLAGVAFFAADRISGAPLVSPKKAEALLFLCGALGIVAGSTAAALKHRRAATLATALGVLSVAGAVFLRLSPGLRIDASSGLETCSADLVWDHTFDAACTGMAAGRKRVYVALPRKLIQMDAETGRESEPLGLVISAPPVLAEGWVLAWGGGNLCAMQDSDWSLLTVPGIALPGDPIVPPAIAGGRAYSATLAGKAFVVDLSRNRIEGDVYDLQMAATTSPVVHADQVQYFNGRGESSGFGLTDRSIWSKSKPAEINGIPARYSGGPVKVPGGCAIQQTADGVEDQIVFWSDPQKLPTSTSVGNGDGFAGYNPCVAAGRLVTATRTALHGIDLATRKKVWTTKVGTPASALVAVPDGRVAMLTSAGLVVVDAATGAAAVDPVWRAMSGVDLCASGGCLLLLDREEGRLRCLRVPAP